MPNHCVISRKQSEKPIFGVSISSPPCWGAQGNNPGLRRLGRSWFWGAKKKAAAEWRKLKETGRFEAMELLRKNQHPQNRSTWWWFYVIFILCKPLVNLSNFEWPTALLWICVEALDAKVAGQPGATSEVDSLPCFQGGTWMMQLMIIGESLSGKP